MQRLPPAQVRFDDHGAPHAAAFGDRYHPRAGAAAQAASVFLGGNGLPERWRGRSDFVVLESGFGFGLNFLATWQAWRDDPARPDRLHYVAIEGHPPAPADLERVHACTPWPALAAALRAAWPPAWPGLHVVDLDDDARVRLHLAWGDIGATLRQLDLQADALFLDGFAPDRNPAMWAPEVLRGLSRRLRPDGTAATWSVAGTVREGLRRAGLEVERRPGSGGKREVLRARLTPAPGRHAAPRFLSDSRRPTQAVVIGAGLGGAWAAAALARLGWDVRVLDRHAAPASEASGNPAGLFHATVHADDSVHAHWSRASARRMAQRLRPWIGAGDVPGAIDGLLRLAPAETDPVAWLARARALDVDPALAEPLDATAASARAGWELPRPAWWFPEAGWVDPRALVGHLLDHPRIGFQGDVDVAAIEPLVDAQGWRLRDGTGRCVAEAPTLVLATAADVARLWPAAGGPVEPVRGQLSTWTAPPTWGADPRRIRVPLAGDGYAIALPDGRLVAGASAAPADTTDGLRRADQAFNRERLRRLTGWEAPFPDGGRVGWRAQLPDRLPIVGPVPAPVTPGEATAPLGRQPREPGLYVLSGLGGRGLTWGALAGEVLAAWVAGTPMPVEARLRDAIDPARWRARAARRGTTVGG